METPEKIRRRRALTTERAREVRQQGHDDALEFALAIGLGRDYQNDRAAKKDVVDLSGDSHSLKGGQKKWQLFLYARDRFINDDIYQVMNGIGQLILECIDAFPPTLTEYDSNKLAAKQRLRQPIPTESP